MKGTQMIKDEGIFQKLMTGGREARAIVIGQELQEKKERKVRFREEGTRSMEVVEPEVERGFLEIAEKGAEREVGIVGGRGGAGSSEVNTTGKEARASARAGFRPMELHMVWNPATARRPEV